MELQCSMQKLPITREFHFSFFGWVADFCLFHESFFLGGKKQKRKTSATKDGITLGSCLINHDENECPRSEKIDVADALGCVQGSLSL